LIQIKGIVKVLYGKNLICLRGELRSGFAMPAPAGILKGTLPAGSLAAQANGPHTPQHATAKR
jgi:hypothetical protein